MKIFKIGCSGFPVAKDRYWERFEVVELDQCFYNLPKKSTAEKWRAEAPGKAEYVVKAWQLITHTPNYTSYRKLKTKIPEPKLRHYGDFQNTDEVLSAWQKTYELAQILKSKIILFQTPSSFSPTVRNITNISKFFKSVKRDGISFVWEPRGGWDNSLIVKMCSDLNLIHAVDPFKKNQLFGQVGYFRLSGILDKSTMSRDKEYSFQDINKLASISDKQVVYVFFDNYSKWKNAIQFQNTVKPFQKNV